MLQREASSKQEQVQAVISSLRVGAGSSRLLFDRQDLKAYLNNRFAYQLGVSNTHSE